MTEDEIAVMDGGKCILQIRGARPFFSEKYDITMLVSVTMHILSIIITVILYG